MTNYVFLCFSFLKGGGGGRGGGCIVEGVSQYQKYMVSGDGHST